MEILNLQLNCFSLRTWRWHGAVSISMINGFKILHSKINQNLIFCIFVLIFPFSEISKVRANLFQINGYVKEPLILPDGVGPPIIHTEKVYVPVKEHPEVSSSYNYSVFIYIFVVSKYFQRSVHWGEKIYFQCSTSYILSKFCGSYL